jgi:hypothetical protein
MTLSFNEYAKKLEALGENVPKIFKNVAKRGAIHFENTAKALTDKEKAVDTGAYRRNWNAEVVEFEKGKYGIVCTNSMEYASFLEDGYSIDKAHFVPFDKMQGSPKTNQIINLFKAKYPNAKGFIAKPRRFTGLKIGKMAIIDTEGWAVIELQEELDAAIMAKKYNISKSQAKKYLR